MDHDAAALVSFGAHPVEKRLARAMCPARRQQDAGIGAVVGVVKLVEQSKILVGERLLVEEDEWAGRFPQIGWERLDEFLAAHRELALVAHTRREGQPDAGRQISPDRGMGAPGALGTVIVKAVVVQERAAAAQVTQRTDA